MLSGNVFWCLALLFLSNGVLTLSRRDGSQELIHKIPHLVRQPLPETEGPASPTSSTSTARPIPYVIVMEQSATREQIQDLNNRLSTEAAPGSLEAETSKRTGLVVFFKADISSAQADAIEKLPGVGAVTPDLSPEEDQPPTPSAPQSSARPSLTPRQLFGKGRSKSPLTGVRNPAHVRLQMPAAIELNVISQPPGSVRAENLPGFGYAAEAGKGVTIYVIDTGANIESPEWKNMKGSKSFIYTPGVEKTETDPEGHGSCMASKVTGQLFGTAKDANIVMVKIHHKEKGLASTLSALVEISNDVYEKGIRGKAVVNLSLGKYLTKKQKSSVTAFRLLLATLMTEDIVIVTASGNARKDGFNKLSDYPALFGRTSNLIVVGAVEEDGSRSPYSQGTAKELTTSAPGEVTCASAKSSTTWARKVGTSFAVPAVVGVIAVWLSQDEHAARLQVPGKVAANVKAMVKEFSYPRIKRGPPVIWNGIDPRGLACESPKRPGDAGSGCRVTVDPPASARPPRPPKPQWSDNPQGFQRVFEEDGVIGHSYVDGWDSSEFDVKGSIEQWCLDRCTGKCASVFIYRILQYKNGKYNEDYFCTTYHTKWSNDYVQSGVLVADAGVAFKLSDNRGLGVTSSSKQPQM
ncbi:Alkaline proteinase [Colletotrichum higginsianum IMI 349063]|nr:Alkaline proteinase [Colletotrichum higginsianum IMI 349063]OBR05706.1 Alkaline proteinase [Colletotrichum higginsianum IMI 349063]